MPEVLRVSITTDDCDDGTAYQHDLPLDVNKRNIMTAVDTLYGHLGVNQIIIYVTDPATDEDEEEDED